MCKINTQLKLHSITPSEVLQITARCCYSTVTDMGIDICFATNE